MISRFSLYGDESETTFWEVALHFLRREKARLLCVKHQVRVRVKEEFKYLRLKIPLRLGNGGTMGLVLTSSAQWYTTTDPWYDATSSFATPLGWESSLSLVFSQSLAPHLYCSNPDLPNPNFSASSEFSSTRWLDVLETSSLVHSCRFFSTLQGDHQPMYNRARSFSADLFNPSETTAKLRRSFSARSLDLLSIDDDLDMCGQEDTGTNGSETCCCYPVSLDTCYDILSDTDAFQVSRLLSK